MQQASSRLRECLAQRNQPVFDETQRLVNEAQPLLWHTLSTFPTGTSHTPKHTLTVEQIASMLLPDAILHQLNDDELQLLILGCHYHDLGMAGTEAENATQASREQARRDHAVRIGEVLRQKWQDMGFRDDALANALAEVCRGHRPPKVDGIASWESIREGAVLGLNRSARLRVVSALVYMADELHIGADRAPTREEEWLQITDEESRRHWKRHQMITGPAFVEGKLRFEVSPRTLALEGDLRKGVLHKALTAVSAGKALLQSAGFPEDVNSILVSWNREELWHLEIARELADLVPRSREEIREAVFTRYNTASSEFITLGDLAHIEPSNESALRSEIDRVVSDYVCQGYLRPVEGDQPDAFELGANMNVAKVFFHVSKEADELDILFEGRHAAHYDFDLQRSAFGVRHTELCVEPLVRATYGVLATSEVERSLFILLKSSPSARHLAVEGAPSPSILSKPHALALIVLSGASLDLLRDPTLILDSTFRNAYRTLASLVSAEQAAFTRLVEELALVDGYTHEQLYEALNPSAEAKEAYSRSIGHDGSTMEGSTQLTISQRIPAKLRPIAVSFPHLFLAGQRAKTTVHLVSTEEAPLSVRENKLDGIETPVELSAITFGPGPGRIAPTFALRADFDFDVETKELRLSVCPPAPVLNCDAPLLMRLDTQQVITRMPATTITFSYYTPALTAKHWRIFMRLAEVADSDSIVARLVRDDGNSVGESKEILNREQLQTWTVEVDDPEFVEFLYAKGPSTQFPWWCPEDVKEAIETRNHREWDTIYERYARMPIREKQEVTSLTLRMAQVDGHEYSEEFFGLIPGLKMGPPKIGDNSSLPQEEVDRMWEESDADCMLAASYSSDEHELAQAVRDWVGDPSKPFPFGFSGDPPGTPVFRSRCEVIHRPRLDRLWYAERRLIIRVRPINDEERWNVEGSYWQSVGDQARESLIAERIAALNTEKDTHSDRPPGKTTNKPSSGNY
jgi:hypothetical protein